MIEQVKEKIIALISIIKEKRSLFITLFFLFILPLTVGAALTVQNIRQRASQQDIVRFVDANGLTINTTDTQDVKLMITLPDGWDIAMGEAQKQNMSFIPQAHAQGCSLAALGSTTKCGQTVYDTCGGYFCASDRQAHFKCQDDQFPDCQGEYICDPETANVCAAKTPTPIPTKAPTSTERPRPTPTPITCDHLINIIGTVRNQNGEAVAGAKVCLDPATPNCDRWQATTDGNGFYTISNVEPGGSGHNVWLDSSSLPSGATVNSPNPSLSHTCANDVKNFTISLPASQPETDNPTPTTPPDQPTVPPETQPRILHSITIENIADANESGGTPRLIQNTNFNLILNRPFSWKLNELRTDQNEAKRAVVVTFFDGTNYIPYTATIKLTRPTEGTNQTTIVTPSLTPIPTPYPRTGSEIPVDVFIDKEFSNPQAIEVWARSVIDSYINDAFAKHSINRRIAVENVSIVADIESCHTAWRSLYPFTDKKIRVYLSKEREADLGWITREGRICLGETNDTYDEIGERGLLHEFGHAIGLADYYFADVSYVNNLVVPIGITSTVKDVMWSHFSTIDSLFHPISREIANKGLLLVDVGQEQRKYTPKQIVFQVLGNEGLPLPRVKVEVFPQTLNYKDGSIYPVATIPNTVSFSSITDSSGRVFLGDQDNLFSHRNASSMITGYSALLRVIHEGQIRYAIITLSYLNRLFFDYEQTQMATIIEPFSQLAETPRTGYRVMADFKNIVPDPLSSNSQRNQLEKHIFEELRAQGLIDIPPSLNPNIPPDATYNLIIQCFGKNVASNATCRDADLTGDGVVDIYDYNRFVESF